uniref:Uncharacterized protein n=1 Tax=Anguilla anguilla TaxID=7936 RepID=A0A0E9QVZ1_ANGAN
MVLSTLNKELISNKITKSPDIMGVSPSIQGCCNLHMHTVPVLNETQPPSTPFISYQSFQRHFIWCS